MLTRSPFGGMDIVIYHYYVMRPARFTSFYFKSSLFTLLSIGGAIFNYALYPALARILRPEELGNFTLIMALSNQILAILMAFNIASIYLVKHYPEDIARSKSESIQKVLIWFFILATFVIALISPIIKTKLKVDHPIVFLTMTLLLITSVPGVVWSGYLQGHKRIDRVGIYTFSVSAAKFILAIIMGSIWGVSGALWGVLLGTLAGLVTLKLTAGISLPRISSAITTLNSGERKLIKEILPYILLCILVVGGLGVMQNIDIVFAKGLFDKRTAGIYSGVSILSNALYYIAFLLIWIILPEIEIRQSAINRRVLGTAYKLIGLLAVVSISVEYLFRNFLTERLLGKNFAGQGIILILATLFQLSLVAAAVYAFYLLVLRNSRALLLGLCVIIPCLAAPLVFGDSVKHMIASLWLAVIFGSAIYALLNRLYKAFEKPA